MFVKENGMRARLGESVPGSIEDLRSKFEMGLPRRTRHHLRVMDQIFNMRVRSWLRMNAGGVPNTCKSNGVCKGEASAEPL